MNRLLISLLFTIFAALSVHTLAQTSKHLVVTDINGGRTFYRLDNCPTVQFQDNLIIISGDSITVEIPFTMADKITYESVDPSGIYGVSADSRLRISGNELEINISGLNTGTTAYIYGITGQLYGTYSLSSGKNEIISISQLPQGIYILKLNGNSYKFQKK